MGSEILAVPEDYLEEVISVIRAGLNEVSVSEDVRYNLTKWCNEEEEYLKDMKNE